MYSLIERAAVRRARPPAVLFFYSPDRKGAHPRAHLKEFRGIIHADGYAGFNELFAGNRIVEAACWVHVRRKFFDVHAANRSPSPRRRSTASANSTTSRSRSTASCPARADDRKGDYLVDKPTHKG